MHSIKSTPPKQVKLLGATVKGLGTVMTVSKSLFSGYALIEDEDGCETHRFFSELSKDDLELGTPPTHYREYERFLGHGVWDEVYSLIPAHLAEIRLGLAA